MDLVASGVNVGMGYNLFDSLDDHLAGSSVLCLEDSPLADPKERAGSNWRSLHFDFV